MKIKREQIQQVIEALDVMKLAWNEFGMNVNKEITNQRNTMDDFQNFLRDIMENGVEGESDSDE